MEYNFNKTVKETVIEYFRPAVWIWRRIRCCVFGHNFQVLLAWVNENPSHVRMICSDCGYKPQKGWIRIKR